MDYVIKLLQNLMPLTPWLEKLGLNSGTSMAIEGIIYLVLICAGIKLYKFLMRHIKKPETAKSLPQDPNESSIKPIQKLFRVFVSSTYEDLKEYRKAAEKAINDLRQKYEGMEYMGAMDKEPTKACTDLIEQCQLLIGIYAWRYGHIPRGAKYSITEQEYRFAAEKGIPCLCYFIDENFAWLPHFIESGPGEKKLKKFKGNISEAHVRGRFREVKDLENKIIKDLSIWLADNRPVPRGELRNGGRDPVDEYCKAVVNDYHILSMIEVERSFDMDGIYIPLTVHCEPESQPVCTKEKIQHPFKDRDLTALDLLKLSEKNIVVLGEPGMGKTTMLQYLAFNTGKKKSHLPIFVKLSDFGKTDKSLESFLLSAVSAYISGPAMQSAVQNSFMNNRALILLDGLDEVRRENYSTVVSRIRAFVSRYENCRVIITSRKAGFMGHKLPYPVYEIDKLPIKKIEEFIGKWFEKPDSLVKCIMDNSRMFELAQNPFLLSIMCFIYGKEQRLPQRRVDLYEKCAVTLLELYDKRLAGKENVYIRYIKERVLQDLAYFFFCEKMNEFPYEPLIVQVKKTLEETKNVNNEESILLEIRENSGLLQQSENNHLFVHRTFYEYYVSRKMRNDEKITAETVLARCLESRWEEPVRLYAAQIDSEEEGSEFIQKLWQQDRALALRCYPDMKIVKPELIKELLKKADVKETASLVKGLKDKIKPERVVATLRELFKLETNGEVIYWGVQILEEMHDTPGASEIVRQKLDDGAQERFKKLVEKDMILIPTGEFKMGSSDDEYDREDDEVLHKVKVNDFYMSRYAVTNELYEQFDPYHSGSRDKYSKDGNQPVIYVNWFEASMFARWLGCRLPTEAQWEYACRAGRSGPFNTGDSLTTDQANYNGNFPYKDYPKGQYLSKTRPVGSYHPNEWKLYDMHGNVWEWCADWYDEKYYETCEKQGVVTDPSGPETGSYRVVRGGGWNLLARCCRSAQRTDFRPGIRGGDVGFRLVFVPQ
ncbi:SUMF1/EgtB/PvdO family nonheme iron enzyme [candidate division KSB1 bacterium]|nr:SUMF1/EgtB/PvdO family nonheme iron enzyme [candidate division KSB1 bacterium]